MSRTNVTSVGTVFNDTRKVKVLSLSDKGPSLETSIFPFSFQVVREPLPFARRNDQPKFTVNTK